MGKHMEKERVHSRGPRPASFSGSRFNRQKHPGHVATRSNYHLLTSLFFRHYCCFGWKLPKGLSFCCACALLLPIVAHYETFWLWTAIFFFQWWFMDLIQLCKWPDLATCTSVHDHLFCGGTLFILFIFLVHVPDLTALQFKNIREFFFKCVLCIFSGPQFHCCFCISAVVVIQIRTCTAPFP